MLTLLIPLLLSILGTSLASNLANPIECESNEFCVATLQEGSECIDGFCSNPFQSGCLRSLGIEIDNKTVWRACNSDDPVSNRDGICKSSGTSSGLEYDEIRILTNSWESPVFEAWILQILLSEAYDVPVSIETGQYNKSMNFYDSKSRFEHGQDYDYGGLKMCSEKKGVCSEASRNAEGYESCGHVMLELWNGAYSSEVKDLVLNDHAEPLMSLGVVGEEHWFVPKFTLQRDNSLSTFHGLTGNENRKKLAERFLRPTRWADYCNEVSEDGCATDDGVAKRRPASNTEEGDQFFVKNLYTGHFRSTPDNDCVASPDTCTGHFIDFPCGWKRFFIQQSHHLDIGLKSNGDESSGGYTYNEMVQIWRAANWTKSDAMGWWWRPDALYQEFQGTDAEFERVNLPNPNSQCVNNRIEHVAWCNPENDTTRGPPEGTCDNPPIPLQKLLSTGLFHLVEKGDVGGKESDLEAKKSPAYDILSQFTVDTYELEEIFAIWRSTNTTDKYGYNARKATCEWVGNNLENLKERLVLRDFPRIRVDNTRYKIGSQIALIFACISLATCLIVLVATYFHRNKNVFRYAQIEFVFLLLLGLILVSVSAILTAVPHTNTTCIASIWFTYVGYTLEIGPLLVKIAAINKLMQGAKKMKRVQLSKKLLYGVVAGLVVFACLYLTLWTAFEPPEKKGIYKLLPKDDERSNGIDSEARIVSYTETCGGDDYQWWYIGAAGIHTVFLLGMSILAFMTRKLKNDINETSVIAFLVYWNFLCMLLRIILISLEDYIDENLRNMCFSLVISIDVFAAIFIYFVPKFAESEERTSQRLGHFMGRATPTTYRTTMAGVSNSRATTTGVSTFRGATTPISGNDPRRETSVSVGDSNSEMYQGA